MRRGVCRKKRLAVVEAFFNAQPPVTQDYTAEMAAFGFDQVSINAATNEPIHTIEVYEENWPAALWFCETQDCYKYSESGICLGLDLPQIVADKSLSDRKTTTDDFKYLKEMARENTRLLNRLLEKQADEFKPKYAAPSD